MQNLSGFLFINKQENVTSYDCIRYLKNFLPKGTKIGHAGTLDPFATGLLIVAIGKDCTKMLNKFINFDKEYIASAKFGFQTDTLDLTGNIIKTADIVVTKTNLEQAAEKLIGSYNQIPPIYSAKKYNGKNLYSLARNNKLDKSILESIVSDKAKKVTIYDIDVLNFDYPNFEFRVKVSSGTYIRSLVNDLAKLNNSFATTQSLVRTKIGRYSIENALLLKDIKNSNDLIVNLKQPFYF